MSAKLIDGKALSKEVLERLAKQVAQLTPALGRKPGLAVVLVGENPASKVYVKAKSKAAIECGLTVTDVKLPASTTDAMLQAQLQELSRREDVDGILLQLPLPKGLDEFAALCAIDPQKDADGLHPLNQGLLLRGAAAPQPCTPKGAMRLIERGRELIGRSTDIRGLHAVVIGRSVLVGKPMAVLLLQQNCTVTICHSHTKETPSHVAAADIVVAAVGKPKVIPGDWIKPGAVVIDVGINRLEDGSLVGDVDFVSACEMAGAITPVPGGAGPMTIAMLLENTVEIAQRKVAKR